jgi:hypothetical protein
MMKIKNFLFPSLSLTLAFAQSVCAQGTAFTYQGSLHNNGAPANGLFDLTFSVFGASSGGSAIAGPMTNAATGVTNGLFTVTLDFGSAPFGGDSRWLEIGVRANGGAAFATLSPRQELTPTPYAIFAGTASNLNGIVSSAQIAGTYSNPVTFNNGADSFLGTFSGQFFGSTFIGGSFVGNFIGSGSGLGDVWHTTGNFGTTPANFIGTMDNQSLVFKVNGQEAARIDPTATDSANFTAGSPINSIDNGVVGALIASGGTTNFLGGYEPNRVSAPFSSIGGGSGHWIQEGGDHSIIASGRNNQIQTNAWESFLGGGEANVLASPWSALVGGEYNTIQANNNYSFIGGGYNNRILTNSGFSFIAGGIGNYLQTNSAFSTLVGGYYNAIERYSLCSVVGGGYANYVHGDSNYWVNNFVFGSTIAGGAGNVIQPGASYSTIGGGIYNTIQTNSLRATIAGGNANTIMTNSVYSTIGGGYLNTINTNSYYATIAGGRQNVVGASGGTIPGGYSNAANGNFSFAAGTFARATNDGSFVLADYQFTPFFSTANNQFSARFTGGVVFETAGTGMTLDGQPILAGIVPAGNLSGTYPNAVTFNNAGNSFSGNGSGLTGVNASTLGGVSSSGFWSTTGNAGTSPGVNYIGTSDGQSLMIKGGFVGIGRSNPIGSEYFGIQAPVSGTSYGGMYINTASATGRPFYGYALGGGGVAWHYIDGNDGNKWKLNYSGDRITVTSGGLVGIGTTAPDATLSVNGTADKPGGGSWTTFSDARLKKNVKPLEGALDRLMRLQGVTFEYKDPDAIHELHGVQIGMIAQEVEKIFPDWVDTAPNGMKRLSVHGFEALAVEAMRQLRTEEDAKLAEFKAANANLQKETDAKLAGLESANTQIRHENEELQKQLAGEKQTVAQLESRLAILEKQFARVAADKEQTTANPPRVVSR